MMACSSRSLSSLEPFDPASHAGNELKAFEQWLRRFQNKYTLVSKLPGDATAAQKDTDQKRWLLDFSLDTVLDVFESLFDTTEGFTQATCSDLITKYKARLKPNQTVTLLRHRFHNLQQLPDETFDTFCNRIKREVVYCDFACTADKDSICRDQIARGVRIDRIRDGCLKNDWSLVDIIKNGRRVEAANLSISEFKADVKQEPSVYHVLPQKNNSTYSTQGKCMGCGRSSCQKRELCIAYNKICNYCRKRNHFETVCMRKKKGYPKVNSSYSHDSSNTSKHTNYMSRMDEHSDDFISNQATKDVNFVAALNGDSDSDESTCDFVKIYAITHNVSSPKTVNIMISDINVEVIPDSGSEANVIPLQKLPSSMLHSLLPTNTILQPYQSKPVVPEGKLFVTAAWGNRQYRTKWYVVDNGNTRNNMPLLSRKASEELGILVINTVPPTANVNPPCFQIDKSKQVLPGNFVGPLSIPENIVKLRNQYPMVFTGVGKLNNRQVKLYEKSVTKPVFAHHREIPMHLQSKVDKEIQYMLDQDIIELVTGPVEWCSNLVIVPKPSDPDEIRIVVDLRNVNKALQDTKKPIPNIEMMKTKFAGKKVFSKIDFRSAFSQIEIEEESRKFLVFRKGNQLYRYKRMTQGLLPASGEFMDVVRPQFLDIPQVELIHDDGIIAGICQEDHDQGVNFFWIDVKH